MRQTKLTVLLLLLALVVWPAAAIAQEEVEQADAEQAASEEMPSPYADPDDGWKEQRFHVGGFYGNLSGGTALGLVENVFFRTQFNMGADAAYGLRFGWVFASRFDLEGEYGRSSPSLVATLTDLQGQGKTEVPFSDLDETWFTASVNYSVIERMRRFVPYLTVGLGVVSVSSEAEGIVKSRKPGLIYGAGVRIRIIDLIALRVDARGLRSGFGTKQEAEDLPGVFVGDFNASNFIWSAGLDIRF
jgi:opacity protein-like surface antigen